jgi:GNAT superfamily N-acetyltransferase
MRDSGKKVNSAEIERTIEAFARGFCFSRSITHPYVWARYGQAWVVRDGPRKNDKHDRREEWITHALSPAALDKLARQHSRGHYCICAVRSMDEDRRALTEAYKSIGYRYGGPEAFMVHRMTRIPNVSAPVRIERVLTRALSEKLAKEVRRKPLDVEFLKRDAPLRQYVAIDGDELVGWVRSIDAGAGTTWCADVYVKPKFRRRGIGRALMARMLRDDRAQGVRRSVLLASRAGATLYPLVGYEQVAELLLYTPKKR